MNKRRRFGIRFKITSGYIVLITFLVAATILLNTQVTNLQKERNGIIQYDSQMRILSNQLERQIVNMESSLHRYLITKDENYIETYYQGLATWNTIYQNLDDLVQNYSTHQKKLPTIHTSIEYWIANIGQPLIDVIATNDSERIVEKFNGVQSSAIISDLQAQFTDFRTTETEAIQQKIVELDGKNRQLTFSLFAILGVIATLTILVFNTISRKITESVNEVTSTILEINETNGKNRKPIVAKTNDEVQDLVDATNTLLITMENRQLFQRNIAEIVTSYQGVDSLDNLGKVLLKELTTRTESVYGAFYIQDMQNKQRYNKIASFADSREEVGRQHFMAGEGYIGQSVMERRMLNYENMEESLRIFETAIGNTEITNGVIVPVLFGRDVVAVLEFAAIHTYSAQQKLLIQEVVQHLGVTINSIQGRMEIIRLLNESQTMTEELQVQSEELQTQSEELKMQTEELKTINEQLEERTRDAEQKSYALEKAQIELEQSAEQLLQSSNYKSEFLANMSHELRTPLNSILILSEMLAENRDNRLSDDELEYANVIHKSGGDLLNLINDILDLSKVEAGKMDLWFSEMDVSEVPQHIQSLFNPLAEQKGIELMVDVSPDMDTIFYTDVKRFHQIINNLLSNAVKFTEQGSISVIIEQAEITSSMQHSSDNWIAITIKDTGIGIPKEKQQIIFESFQQADGATVRKYGGTGLGLSICREFTKLLGGWMSLISDVGQGSTFTVFLPSLPDGNIPQGQLVQQEVAFTDAPQLIETHMDKTVFDDKHILIVDDDYRNIYALKQALEHKGVKIIEANNGVECLNILQTEPRVDLVLMDIMMPEMDGYEAMERIRRDLNLTELPIIALTAKAMKHDRDRAIESGASDYISKPLNLDQLFSVLSVWLTSEERLRNE